MRKGLWKARIQADYPRATYVWCANHKLNLVIVSACKEPAIRNMQDTTDQCVRFFTNSSKRENCLKEVMTESTGDFKKLKELCKTRWIERHVAYNRFLDLHEQIVMALETIAQGVGFNRESANEASTLLISITKFEFICALVAACKTMSYLQPLTTFLQARSLDLHKAFDKIKLLKNTLQSVRDEMDEMSQRWFDEAVRKAGKVNVLPSLPRLARRQVLRVNAPAVTPLEHFQRNVLYPFFDHVIADLNRRFEDDLQDRLVGMLLVPKHLTSQISANTFAQYDDDIPHPEDLEAELNLWKTHWKTRPTDEIGLEDTLKYAHDANIYPNIKAILILMAVLPVTSCESERSFNQLKLLKTSIRNRMSEERLNGLALMKIHRGIAQNLDAHTIIDLFAQHHPRKMELENIFID